MEKGKHGYLGCISGWFGSLRGAPNVTDGGLKVSGWVDGHERDALDAILLRNGLILTTLGMDKGKCGYVGCISGWFGALRGAPRVKDG